MSDISSAKQYETTLEAKLEAELNQAAPIDNIEPELESKIVLEPKFDNENKPCGIKRIYLASLNSLRAFKWLVNNESAFKQELLLLITAVPTTFLFNISAFEQVILILAIVFVMFTEVINTAIEVVVDRVGLEIHPLSGLAKDLGSAAVLLSMVMAISLWLVILL